MKLVDSMVFSRPAPANLQPGDARIFATGPCRCATVEARVLENVAFNPSGELFAASGVLAQSFLDERQYSRRDIVRYERRTREAFASRERVEEGLLWICDRQSHNYHHWLADALPRLEAWLLVHDHARLVLPRRMAEQEFVARSLTAYPQVEIAPAPAGPALAPALVVPGKVAPAGRHHDFLVGRAAARLRSHFAADVEPRGRRLHVSRRGARLRRIANEGEILPVFARHGFETVVLEELEFGEQVRELAGAAFLAGPHGAGLANMLFMAGGEAVLEMRQPEGPPLCFMELAAGCGHAYRYLACEPADPLAHPHAADILVNPEALDLELAQAQ